MYQNPNCLTRDFLIEFNKNSHHQNLNGNATDYSVESSEFMFLDTRYSDGHRPPFLPLLLTLLPPLLVHSPVLLLIFSFGMLVLESCVLVLESAVQLWMCVCAVDVKKI